MSASRTVAAVVVTHNRAEHLRKCLDAILGQRDAHCDAILVVDNGSADDTPALLESYAGAGVVRLDVGFNSGSAGGFHLGVYEATMRGYDLVWVMDDDVVPSSRALWALLSADRALGGEWGFLSSVAYWTDGELCKPNVQKKGLFTFVSAENYDWPLAQVRIAAMASLMLRADVVREVGLPIAEYFFYTDDYEYTARISRGHPCYMVPASAVTHEMERNEKPNLARDSEARMWRYEYLYRNDVHFYRGCGVRGVAYLAAKAAYTTANVMVNGRGHRAERLRTLAHGLVAGLSFRPRVVHVDGGERCAGT